MSALRPTLPKIPVGDTNPRPIVSEAQVGGGKVYYFRIAAWTVASAGLDANGLGLHARIVRTNAAEACAIPHTLTGTVPGVSSDTDIGNHVVYDPATAEPRPVEMPYWDVDFDRGIWIPKGLAVQIYLVGGDPDLTTLVYPAFVSHELFQNEPPPPLTLTFASIPDGTTLYLVDRPATSGTPLPSIHADVHGATELWTPQFAATSARTGAIPLVALNYDDPATITQTIPASPGVPISLAGAVSVTFTHGGQWVFRVRF